LPGENDGAAFRRACRFASQRRVCLCLAQVPQEKPFRARIRSHERKSQWLTDGFWLSWRKRAFWPYDYQLFRRLSGCH
jgi:hypothetical protein